MSGILTPYTASCWLDGKRRSGIEVVRPNTYTVLVRYDGEVIKRHFTKHGVKLHYQMDW